MSKRAGIAEEANLKRLPKNPFGSFVKCNIAKVALMWVILITPTSKET